jgi:hypothetical protein
MADSGFWKVRQTECERYAQRFPELRAVWNAKYGTWRLWWGSTPDGLEVPPEPAAALNDIALKCITQLPNAQIAYTVNTGDPMTYLLDYLREFMQEREWYFDLIGDRARQERKWGFQVTHRHPVSKRMWMAGVRSGKSPVQVLKDHKDLGEEEESEPYQWLESGRFGHIFQALAVLSSDLAGHAFELAAAESRAGRPNDVSARLATATESSFGSHKLNIPRDPLDINPSPKGGSQHVAPTPRWTIVTGINGEAQQKKLRERFEHVVREALAELGYRFRGPLEAIEAWLDFVLRESAYSTGTAIAELGAASKHEVAELKVLARESGNRVLSATLGRLEARCEFPKSLHAILRVDFCVLPEDIRLRATHQQAKESPVEVEKRYPERAAWLETQLALRKWNVHDLQGQAGPDWKSARKILDGLQVSRSVLEKTAAALSKKNKQVLFRDIPQE